LALDKHGRILRAIGLQLAIIAGTLATMELVLRVADVRYLRLDRSERSLLYDHDPELGWFPIPNLVSKFTGLRGISANREISVQNNSIGLRDIEHDDAPKETILVLGDSFVWGYDVEADERLTSFLRKQLPDKRIVNAGVSGYGTDQEYLLLRRLWDRFKPDIVVLIVYYNDHLENASNSRYDGTYKPYFVWSGQAGEFRGIPVPKSRHYYFRNNPLAERSLLVRLVISAYVALRHPAIEVPDATEQLVGRMRDLVKGRGARFLVGELDGGSLVPFLRSENIPYVSLDELTDREDLRYPVGGGLGHWTPAGHAVAGAAILRLLRESGALAPTTAVSNN